MTSDTHSCPKTGRSVELKTLLDESTLEVNALFCRLLLKR